MDEQSLREMALQGATAAGAGVVGRLVALSRRSDRRLGWNLLWELPAAIGLGMLGLAVGEHFHLGPWETNASGFVIAYLGPLAIDEIVRRWGPRAGKGRLDRTRYPCASTPLTETFVTLDRR